MSKNQSEVVKFLNYLSNPNALGNSDLSEIKDWVEKYPYSQSLKFIAVKAAQNHSNYQALLAQAATVIPSRKLLYDFVHQPESFNTTVFPFSVEDTQTIEERQIAVANEEKLDDVEDKSKLSFGININEIFGSEYQKEVPIESEIKIIEEEETQEEVLASVDENQVENQAVLEEESSIENIEEETQEEVLATVDEEVLLEESPVENIEEEEPQESLATVDEKVLKEKSSVENIEEETKEEVSATVDEKVLEEESPIENIEEETEEDVLASVDENQVENEAVLEEEYQVENIEEETQEEVSASADEEVLEVESPIENIEEETQEEISASADEEILELESLVENIEEETQEEVFAIADENQVQNEAVLEEKSPVENIEEETQEDVSASVDEKVIEEESLVEDIEEETQEEVSASIDEKVIEEESLVEDIEEETIENISAPAKEEVLKEETTVENIELESKEKVLEEETSVENIEEETSVEVSAIADEEKSEKVKAIEEVSFIDNLEEETDEELTSIENIEVEKVEETEQSIQNQEPAFKYAPQTDFFALNRKDKVEEKQSAKAEIEVDESVSAYNDESMPYTFLWWLNKTRKEHAINNQPYNSFKLDTSKQIKNQPSDGLNHQIAENIFHLRGVEELSSSATNYTVPFDFRKKEFQIIEKFIKEEPQIRPPAANKIDSENKAKKSSEDKNQVVSETLAKIYVEQMLYHKALDVYKKLSLKFPEKSTYFASQIKYLELKVN